MRYWLQQLLDRLWPSRSGPKTADESRAAYLRIAIVLVVVLAAGPELIVLMDLAALTALLEVLGGALFLTAFASGARLLLVELGRAIRSMLLPLAPLLLVVRPAVPRLEKMRVVAYVSASAAWWLVFALGF